MISVITINLNELKGLKQISKLLESYHEVEWIVIDGESNDGSQEFIRSNKSISKYKIERDQGIYDAMNKGINLFTNDYAIFLNSGDKLINIEKLISLLKTEKSEIIFFDSKKRYKYMDYYRSAKDIDFIEYGMPAIHQSIVYSKTLLKDTPFDTSYKISSDYAQIATIYNKNPISKKINIPISVFESGGISTIKSNVVYKECQRVQREILKISEFKIFFYNIRRLISHFFNKILN